MGGGFDHTYRKKISKNKEKRDLGSWAASSATAQAPGNSLQHGGQNGTYAKPVRIYKLK